MTGSNFVDPTPASFARLKALDRDQPFDMLNLIRYRDRAEYPEDHALAKSLLTGAEAYALYGTASNPIFVRVGGTIIWSGTPYSTLIGPDDERWDIAFIARYPNARAFLEMVTDVDYRRAVVHRQAAVADSRLIRMGEPQLSGDVGRTKDAEMQERRVD
jgi:uncharacterized protein (DUF1330 family)